MTESDEQRAKRHELEHRAEMTQRARDAAPAQAGSELLPGTEDYERKEKLREQARKEQAKK